MNTLKDSGTKIRFRLHSYIAVHRILTLCLVGVITIWGVTGTYLLNELEEQRASKVALSKQLLEEMDLIIERHEAEKQKKLEEEKKSDHAADAEQGDKIEEAAVDAPAPKIQETPRVSTGCNWATAHANPNAIDVLVNKKHCLMPLDFAPSDLVTTHGATISAKAAHDINRMIVDAAAAGQPLTVSSSYRSYGTQVSTYNYWVSINGQQGADTVSARPGFSEHQTGLAVDIGAGSCTLNCFGSTSQYQWLQANAANYGFIQRYYNGYEAVTGYAAEEWHYRYVGTATARDMKSKRIMTLEQYWGMDGGDYR